MKKGKVVGEIRKQLSNQGVVNFSSIRSQLPKSIKDQTIRGMLSMMVNNKELTVIKTEAVYYPRGKK